MQVTSVKLGGFKSLYDVTCQLDRLTVITGPNGSGKSNLVDGLNFLGEVYAHGLEFAVSRAGGFDNIAHRRTRRAKKPVTVVVEVSISADDLRPGGSASFHVLTEKASIPEDFSLLYRHSFSLRTSSQSLHADYEVVEDLIEILDQKRRVFCRFEKVEGRLAVWFTDRRYRHSAIIRSLLSPYSDENYKRYMPDRAILSSGLLSDQMQYANLLWAIKRALGGTKVFQLSPFQCRTSGVPTPNASLERQGQNLPGAADHLRRNDKEAWKKVQRAMRSIMPALQGIEIAYTEDRRLALQFREQGVGRPWTTGEVSDGTIQAFALFVALYDRRGPLLVIEEPENSVHPWILRQFVDLCREVEGKQILLTTHSPVLLNYVPAKIVSLMSLISGRSRLMPLLDLSTDIRRLVLSGEVSLFDAYDSGIFSAAVPPGLSPDFDVSEGDE